MEEEEDVCEGVNEKSASIHFCLMHVDIFAAAIFLKKSGSQLGYRTYLRRLMDNLREMLADDDLSTLLGRGREHLDKVFEVLYRHDPLKKKAFAAMTGASSEEKDEVWHLTMEAFYFNVWREKFKGEASISTYIVSIARNQWLGYLDKKIRARADFAKNTPPEKLPDRAEDLELHLLLADTDEAYQQELKNALSHLSERCQKMLLDWANGKNVDFLRAEYEFSNKHMAKKESYNCRERLRKWVHDHPNVSQKLQEWFFRIA